MEHIETSKGGILLAKSEDEILATKKATLNAYIEKIGMTAWKAFDDGEPWAKVGDLVLIAKYSGEDMIDEENDEIYRLINDEDIIATLEE